MLSAFRPAARRLLSARPTSLLARSQKVTSITAPSVRLSRSVLSLPTQRRWNSSDIPKETNTKAEAESLPSADDSEVRILEDAVASAKEERSTSTAGEASAEIAAEEQAKESPEEITGADGIENHVVDDLEDAGPRRYTDKPSTQFKAQQRYIPKETIYVGNLFFDVTADDLKARMAEYGTVEHAKIVHDARGLSKGFGYVTFASVESAANAIAGMNQQTFEGRRAVVQYAAGVFKASSQRNKRDPTRTLYIGNISFDMTDRELKNLFKSVRNIVDVRVAIDRQTGQPRGFAHADFIDVASAQEAFEILSAKAPHGRRLRVDYSEYVVGQRRSDEPSDAGSE